MRKQLEWDGRKTTDGRFRVGMAFRKDPRWGVQLDGEWLWVVCHTEDDAKDFAQTVADKEPPNGGKHTT